MDLHVQKTVDGSEIRRSPVDRLFMPMIHHLVNKHGNGLSLVSIGNTSSEGPFSMAMLVYQRVQDVLTSKRWLASGFLNHPEYVWWPVSTLRDGEGRHPTLNATGIRHTNFWKKLTHEAYMTLNPTPSTCILSSKTHAEQLVKSGRAQKRWNILEKSHGHTLMTATATKYLNLAIKTPPTWKPPITSFMPAVLLVGTNSSILLFLTKTFSATTAEVSLCCVQVTCLIIPKASIDLSSFKDSILPNASGFLTTPQNSKNIRARIICIYYIYINSSDIRYYVPFISPWKTHNNIVTPSSPDRLYHQKQDKT